MRFLVKGGKVFSEGKFVDTDILVEDSKIIKLGPIKKADKIIDASNKYVLPGLIDMHVHFRDFGQEHKEDWISGGKAALKGGIATVLEMPNNIEPITTPERYEKKKKAVAQKTLVNFGLYFAVTNDNIAQLNSSGIRLAKLYYGETVGSIKIDDAEEIFRKLRKDIFLAAHCEDNSVIKKNMSRFDPSEPRYHSLIRDSEAERKAVDDLIQLAEKYDRQLHITHVSSKESMELIWKAKDSGLKVTCDTCCHYLFLDDSLYEKAGNRAKVNPALKSKKDKEALWDYLKKGCIDCISSDHAPHTIEEKQQGMSGFPGVETTTRLMLTAVNSNKIGLERFAELMSRNPAKITGIKNKGEIKEGFDADLTIIDINKKEIIGNMESKAGWSPYRGMETKGMAVQTIVMGNHKPEEVKFR